MNCHEINLLLHAYVDGELDLMRSLEVEQHLENCSTCAALRRLLQSLHTALLQSNLSYPAPPTIWRVF
jgi:anti-sigma factor RsiW